MNTVTLVGNLTRDPELRIFENKSVANASIAVNESYKDNRTGEWKETVTFVDLSIWNNNGSENVAGSLGKGDRVLVTGKLKMNQWQTDDGQNRSKLELLVSEIGPTLKWAEVDITKNPKFNGGQTPSNLPPEEVF